jgi:hypothetical protein
LQKVPSIPSSVSSLAGALRSTSSLRSKSSLITIEEEKKEDALPSLQKKRSVKLEKRKDYPNVVKFF